jgi:hypothetical protein
VANVLFEEVGPNGNVQAVVEADEDVCYFYLFSADSTGQPLKSVWVRNLSAAPQTLDVEWMQSGHPPRNPSPHCRHPFGSSLPSRERLHVVWLPEGNGVALYEGEEILAIIPPWSGINGFDGYARDAIGTGPLAWELLPDNVLYNRFAKANAYWKSWDDENLWPSMQETLIGRIESSLGPHSNYYAIDGGHWPPKALLRIPRRNQVALVTVGVSARPQPNVDMQTDAPEELRRIELGALLPQSWSDEAIKKFAAYVSGQSNLPWEHYTWLGPGHTLPCDSWNNPGHKFAILLDQHPAAPRLDLGKQFDDPVKVVWLLPITGEERQLAIDHGSEQLLTQLPASRWEQA